MSIPVLDSRGTKRWILNTKLHRDDGPAVEFLSGSKMWFLDNKLHRDDGPAIEHIDGRKEWYLDDKRHRVGGPATEYSSGTKHWYIDGKLHRDNGPAVEDSDGAKYWYINNKLHRLDGPAIEWSVGIKHWYLDDKQVEQSEYYALLKLRKIRYKVIRFNNALKFDFMKILQLSRTRTAIEWYYSPNNGGGKLAKKRLEHILENMGSK